MIRNRQMIRKQTVMITGRKTMRKASEEQHNIETHKTMARNNMQTNRSKHNTENKTEDTTQEQDTHHNKRNKIHI